MNSVLTDFNTEKIDCICAIEVLKLSPPPPLPKK